jgi:hypothetical protein
LRIDHFEDKDGRKFVNVYLIRNENIEDYQALIDELSKKHLVTIFVPGTQPIVDTIKRMLSDY